MADLTLSNLDDKLPAGTLTQTADDVTISLKALMGETAVQLTDEKVAEMLSKLAFAASQAQVDYNANAGTPIASYPNPTFGTPVASPSGGFFARRTHTIAVNVPLDINETTAV